NELAADNKGLRKSARFLLLSIGERYPVGASIPKKSLEPGKIERRRDDQDLAYPRQHENAERIIDHRLIEDGQQLLRDGQRRWVKARAAAASKDDPQQRPHRSSSANR